MPQFLNVDLHVESRQDLDTLATALDAQAYWQTWDHKGVHFLHRSLGLGRRSDTPSAIILGVTKQVQRLRGAARAAWNAAKVKEFDIGIQADRSPARGEWTVSVEGLQAASRVGAQIRITV